MKDLKVGDSVRINNENIESHGAVGEITAVSYSGVTVKLKSGLSPFWAGNKTVNYSRFSVEHYNENRIKDSPSSNVAVFFEDRKDAVKFLKTGHLCSEDADIIDVVSVETLRDCDLFLEKLEDEVASAIESLVFKGVMYDVKRVLTFVEVEEDE